MTHQHYMIYKPYGYLSQFVNNQHKRRNKKLLGDLYNFPDGVMAVGRLDEKSEGLLLLTTNGQVSEHIRSSKVEKEYWVMVDGIITEEACKELINGVEISIPGCIYLAKAKTVKIINTPEIIPERFIRDQKHGPVSWISIVLTEGKFRQIRKMSSKVGFPTLRLIRVRIGSYKLDHYIVPYVKAISEADFLLF